MMLRRQNRKGKVKLGGIICALRRGLYLGDAVRRWVRSRQYDTGRYNEQTGIVR